MRISQKHTNRRAHNWLIYDIGDHFLLKFSSSFKGVMYDLGAGESPYKDFFLEYADQYIAVDWAGSFHNTKADIATDLNKPLPIESDVADTVVSLSEMEHLCEPQTMWVLKMNYFSQRLICGPRPLCWAIKTVLLPFWYLGQKVAPLLDRIDKNWALETSGYYVTAKKQ